MKNRSCSCYKDRTHSGQSGQIIVEYILLLVIGVAMAVLISSTMVSRNPESPGFLITKWIQIITVISSDMADDTSAGSGS